MLDTTFPVAFELDGLEGVLKYSFVMDLLSFDFIVSPICSGDHWYLVIIDLKRTMIIELESMLFKQSKYLRRYATLIESLKGRATKNLTGCTSQRIYHCRLAMTVGYILLYILKYYAMELAQSPVGHKI